MAASSSCTLSTLSPLDRADSHTLPTLSTQARLTLPRVLTTLPPSPSSSQRVAGPSLTSRPSTLTSTVPGPGLLSHSGTSNTTSPPALSSLFP